MNDDSLHGDEGEAPSVAPEVSKINVNIPRCSTNLARSVYMCVNAVLRNYEPTAKRHNISTLQCLNKSQCLSVILAALFRR